MYTNLVKHRRDAAESRREQKRADLLHERARAHAEGLHDRPGQSNRTLTQAFSQPAALIEGAGCLLYNRGR